MTSYENILAAVVSKLEKKFPNVEMESADIEEGFSRPSFFTSIGDATSEDFMSVSSDNQIPIRIIYFPTDRTKNQVELLCKRHELRELFLQENRLEITDDLSAEIEEIELKVIDKVLHCNFDLVIYEDYNRVEDYEQMEDIKIEMKG